MISRESQDRSIKARKHEMFQEEQVPDESESSLGSFATYVEKTPAAPLSLSEKAILGAIGALVMLLFLAAVLTINSRRSGPPPVPKTAEAGAPGH